MARELFSTSLVSTTSAVRRGRLLPVSILLHAALLAGVFVLPLVADTELPDPSTIICQFTPVVTPPIPPEPPRVVGRHAAPRAIPANVAPISVPDSLPTRDSGIEFTSEIAEGDDIVCDGCVGIAGGIAEAVPPEPPPAPPREPVRAGGVIERPTRIRDVAPEYPTMARTARVEGMVILEAVIDERGHVTGARVLKSIPLLDEAALAAVRQWEFTPTRLNGQPVAVVMTVTVDFRLQR